MIAVVLSAALAAIAGLHIYWGVGGRWPGQDEISLARTVAGFRNVTKMPSSVDCFVVAVALMAAALWPLMLARQIDIGLPRWLILVGGFALALVFVARGIAAYMPAWRRLAPEQPFARLDRSVYGPLCLTLGGLWMMVTVGGLSA